MATKTRKSASRSSKKKSSSRQRSSGKRKSVKRRQAKSATARRPKAASRGTGGSTGLVKTVRKTTRRGLKTAREGLESVQQVAEKALTAARSTAVHTFGEVKARIGMGEEPPRRDTNP